jgi:circadian clock protein KaiC
MLTTQDGLQKVSSGIRGLDDIMGGGLPKGRPILVAGRAGCGKTVLAMEFLVRGALEHGEPGVFMAFEETAKDLKDNFTSLGFDLDDLVERKLLVIDHVRVERSEIEETGEYDLEGLFIRLDAAIRAVAAKRVVLDTIESLFSGLDNAAILRAELRRLFAWLKQRSLTTVITGESGEGPNVTRQGLEEYVSDCVIALDHRITDQLSTRRLRVAKYRGSAHGTNEYPFVIDTHGISILPITSIRADYATSVERVSSGVPRLDAMFSGKGYYRGSSVLLSGSAGTGKTTLAAHFLNAACARGERSLFLAFEESSSQVIRNMRSVGIDLGRWVEKGLLAIHASRPTLTGLEMHLVRTQALIQDFRPEAVVADPVTSMITQGTGVEVRAMLSRLVDYLKDSQATFVCTTLTHGGSAIEATDVAISSIVDTWIMLRSLEIEGERNRVLTIVKSRGMAHSNQMREYAFTPEGIVLSDVYVGPGGVLTGAARASQEARDQAQTEARRFEMERSRRALDRKRRALEAQIALLQTEFEAQEEEIQAGLTESESAEKTLADTRINLGRIRQADGDERVLP